MAAGSASPPAVSDLREGWSGQAFTRVGECAPEKALQLAAEITSKLDDIKPLLGELDRLGWDGGVQPAYVNATKLDEVSRRYTICGIWSFANAAEAFRVSGCGRRLGDCGRTRFFRRDSSRSRAEQVMAAGSASPPVVSDSRGGCGVWRVRTWCRDALCASLERAPRHHRSKGDDLFEVVINGDEVEARRMGARRG